LVPFLSRAWGNPRGLHAAGSWRWWDFGGNPANR